MRWTYQPALDGVRAFAVYLVILFHAGVATFSGGFMAVDIFFVLSGFLVSNVILNEIRRKGRLDLGRFFARRVRRLLPAAVTVVVATSGLFLLIGSVVRRLPLIGDAQASLLYVANWRFLSQQTDYFATDVDRSPFLHFWSLAIEEQFYVLFPLLLIGLLALSRRARWVLPAGIALLALASVAAQTYWQGVDPGHAYYGTDARIYQLLAGVLLALFMLSRHARRWPAGTAPLGLLMLVVLATGLVEVDQSQRNQLATIGSLLLIGGLYAGPRTWFAHAMSVRPMVYLGEVSYATYLWHWPVLLVVMEFVDANPVVFAAIAAVLATGLAAVSNELLESPIRRAPSLDRFRWRVPLVGVTVSALVALFLVPPVLEAQRKPVVTEASGSAVSPALEEVAAKPKQKVPEKNWKAIRHDLGDARQCPDSPADCRATRGDGARVVLIGDSKARMLEPMMARSAEEHDLTLFTNIVPGCPWQADLRNSSRPADNQRECIENRAEWYRTVLPKMRPDVVLLVSNDYDYKADAKHFSRVSGDRDETHSQMMLHTTQETLDLVRQAGAHAVVMRNIAEPDDRDYDPLDCLASSTLIAECTVVTSPPDPPSDAWYERAATARDSVSLLNINPVICPDAPLCRPILDGTVVWRDHNHLTTKILLERGDRIWQRIVATGALPG